MTATVLITGATDGIGLELARLHARDGARLVLHGRRPLGELADPLFTDASYVQADLGDPGAHLRIAAFVDAAGIERLDLVVHNAAVGSFGPIARDPPGRIVDMVQVNVGAPVALTRALAPRLEAAAGKVVFVSSIAADLPCPDYAVYAATKAALGGLARSLRVEWQGRIAVQVVQPGAVRTGFHAKSGVPAKFVSSPKLPTAAQAAAAIHRLAASPARTPVLGRSNAFLRWMGRRAQRPLERAMRKARTRALRRASR